MHTLLLLSIPAQAAIFDVDSITALRTAVDQAAAGDTIRVAPGTYTLTESVRLANMGTADQPIRIEGDGAVTFEVDSLIGFRVTGAHWAVDQVTVVGTCPSDHDCEHAFHVVGQAEGFALTRSVLRNWNAPIKANGEGGFFPDAARIKGSELYNDAPRQTDRPVVAIDVVGASDWVVEGNHIHDFEKAGGNGISYSAFFKGNGSGGRFVRNLVVCEDLHAGGVRLGLSLGGGGTAPDSVCRHEDCSVEHTGGVLENNIIADCPADVGVYLNKAADSEVVFNTVYNTTGIDVRFAESTVWFSSNVMDGPIRERDGGTAELGPGTDATPDDVYRDPEDLDFYVTDPVPIWVAGDTAPEVDFCGFERTERTTMGAVDGLSDCNTDTMPGTVTPDDSGEDGDGPGTEPGDGSGDGAGDDAGDSTDDDGRSDRDEANDVEMPTVEVSDPETPEDDRTSGTTSGCQVAASPASFLALFTALPILFGRRRTL